MKERMSDLHKKSDFQKKEVHKFMLDQDAYKQVNWKKYVNTGPSIAMFKVGGHCYLFISHIDYDLNDWLLY